MIGDLSQLSKSEFLAQFVISLQAKGVFLAYDEYRLLSKWLEQMSGDHEKLAICVHEALASSNYTLGVRACRKSIQTAVNEHNAAPCFNQDLEPPTSPETRS